MIMAQTIEQLIEFIATTETPKSVTNPIVAEALSLLLGKTYRLFDGDKVNNIVQEGGIPDVFNVDPKVGDLLYSPAGEFGEWGIITDVHLEGEWLFVTYTWRGYINTIKLDKDGQEARYVNRYKKPTVFDAESVLSASPAGNMQDYFLVKGPDMPGQSYFEFWKVGDLIGSPKGGIIVSDILNPGGLDNTMMYIYGGEIVTITYKAQSPAKILSVSKAKIGSPEDAANATGSLYARVAFNKKEIGTSTDEAKADGSLYARIAANKQAIGNSTDAAKEDGSLYARIADVNNRINESMYSPFYALRTETDGNNTVSVKPYYFGETPIVMSGQKGCTEPVNRYKRALLGISRSFSLKYSDIANFDDFVGWITVGYNLVFLYRKNGEDVINETIQAINSGSDNFNSARDVVYILDFFRNKAIIQGIDRTQNKIVTYDNRDISNVDKTLFESAYLYSATQMYSGSVAQNYLLANAYFSASEYLNKYPVIGMFSEGIDFAYREQHKRVKSTSVTIFNASSGGSVDYELQEGRHIIANVNVTGTGNSYCSPRVHTNIDSEFVIDLYIIIRFKILSGSCSIKKGTSGSFYVIDDNYNFAEKDSLTCEVGREYLVQASYRGLIEVSYANKYYFKMFGNFKIEVIDAFVSIPHSQINCAERFKNVYTGNIPFIPANKNIAIEFPLIQYEGVNPIVIGKMKMSATGDMAITVEQNNVLVLKKITQ